MSAEWPKVHLEEVITQRKEFIEIDDFKEYKRCRVQLHAKGIVLRDIVPGLEIKTKKQQVCSAGEFLVAEIDAKVGGFGVVPDELDGAIVSSHYFLFEINETKLDRKFLDFFIRTPNFSDQVSAQGSTNYAAIRPNDVLGYQIPLPPLDEQRRTVARIEELAAKIEEAQKLRRQAAEEADAVVASSAHNILTSSNQVEMKPLKELVTIRGGGTPSKANPLFWEGPVPWVSPKDMKCREIFNSIDHISEDATSNSPAKILPPGAVLIVVRGMILAHTVPSAVLRVPAAINQDIKALIPLDGLTSEYLCSALWALNAKILDLIEKSSHDTRKLQTPKLLDFKIPLPSIDEQRRIVARLDELQAKVDGLKRCQARTAEELDALLPAVLERAFRSEL
jgi:type I restriction enzyme S subunit